MLVGYPNLDFDVCAQQQRFIAQIDRDAHWYELGDLGEVAGGVAGGQDRHHARGGWRDCFDPTGDVRVQRIDVHDHLLAELDTGNARLLDVGDHPQLARICQRDDRLASRHVGANGGGVGDHDAIQRRLDVDPSVATAEEVQLGLTGLCDADLRRQGDLGHDVALVDGGADAGHDCHNRACIHRPKLDQLAGELRVFRGHERHAVAVGVVAEVAGDRQHDQEDRQDQQATLEAASLWFSGFELGDRGYYAVSRYSDGMFRWGLDAHATASWAWSSSAAAASKYSKACRTTRSSSALKRDNKAEMRSSR